MDGHINSPTRLAYPVLLNEHQNTVLASFPDVPEALTEGATEQEALEEAVDCLVAALAPQNPPPAGRRLLPQPKPPSDSAGFAAGAANPTDS